MKQAGKTLGQQGSIVTKHTWTWQGLQLNKNIIKNPQKQAEFQYSSLLATKIL